MVVAGGLGRLCLRVFLTVGIYIFGRQLFTHPEAGIAAIGLMLFFGLMTFSLSRKWLPFVRLAEKVFRALELPDPSNVDLVKSSKAQRTERDPGEFGTFYFRY